MNVNSLQDVFLLLLVGIIAAMMFEVTDKLILQRI